MTEAPTLLGARAALNEHAWQEAYDQLSTLAEREELDGEDLERLGEAAWWTARPDESLEAFERAYSTHVREGNRRRAAFVAVRVAVEYADRLDTALWKGWLSRATRALDEEPDCVEKGYLDLALVRASMEVGSLANAMEHATAAHRAGLRFGDRDLEAFGLVLQGGILIFQREVEKGFSLIDEGTLAAVRGELSPFIGGSVYCVTIGVCRSLADYRRASEWTEAAARWCERQSITGFPGVCRVQRAEIMRLRGAFGDAEEEARKARDELTAFGRLPQAGAGAYEIGEVRLRRGDLDGAEEAFGEAHRLGHDPQPGLALLWLARTRIDAAQSAVRTVLAEENDDAARSRLLAARVEIAIAAHDHVDAREAAEELGAIATRLDAPMVHAAAHQALGEVLTHEETAAAAITELRRAVRRWTEAEAPFETAQARRALAIAHRAGGDEASAVLELKAAMATFESLGARLETNRCADLIQAGAERDTGRRVTRTFLFTDIVGSTNLIGTIGDEAWKELLRWHDDTLRTLIASHRGEVVRSTGDGLFAAFRDPSAATGCAVAIQRRLTEHRRRHGFAPQLRIGLHSAEATAVADDYAGLGVHTAARVGALAEGGEILATTETVASLPISVTAERTVALKGLPNPVRVVSIDWREHGSLTTE